MASFTPITSNKAISYVSGKAIYRNAARENMTYNGSVVGTPVYYAPYDAGKNYSTGYGGPRYKYGYTYNNSPSPENTYNGNCTWWCWCRLYEAVGTYLPAMGNANQWYANYSGSKSTNANNIQPGDIIVFSDSSYGHVMFVEKVSGSTITISQSAHSTRSVWSGKACLVTTYTKSEITAGNTVNMYKNLDSSGYNITVTGVIHTGGSTPPSPGVSPSVSVAPVSRSVIVHENMSYVDMDFTITVTGIPQDENATNAISFSSNCYRYAYTTSWTYTNYTQNGTTYRRAERSLTVRYDRLYDYAYNDTAYMYYIKTFTNGSVNSTTPMYITIKDSNTMISIYSILARKLSGFRRIKIKIK